MIPTVDLRVKREKRETWYYLEEFRFGKWRRVQIPSGKLSYSTTRLGSTYKERAIRHAKKYRNSLSLPIGELQENSLGLLVYAVEGKQFLSFRKALAYAKEYIETTEEDMVYIC